jgi:hypothetical protein
MRFQVVTGAADIIIPCTTGQLTLIPRVHVQACRRDNDARVVVEHAALHPIWQHCRSNGSGIPLKLLLVRRLRAVQAPDISSDHSTVMHDMFDFRPFRACGGCLYCGQYSKLGPDYASAQKFKLKARCEDMADRAA